MKNKSKLNGEKMKRVNFYFIFIVLNLLFIQPSYLFSQSSGYRIIDKIKIGGEADWDYLSIYKPEHQLFVSHDTEVDVIDLSNNTLAGKITGLKGVHGIAFAPEYGKGFISDGKQNSVVIFNLKNLKVIKKIQTIGKDPDAILYDAYTKRIFAFNGHSTTATAIDAKTNKLVGEVQLSGSPEFGVSDFKGRIFVNIEKKNEINVINPKTLKVTNTWLIPPCESPSAMAIDRENNRLFIGARNQIFAVVDANSGKVIAHFPIGPGVDACSYDPQAHLIFCSNKDATMSIFKQNSHNHYSFVENLKTGPKAKTMALDEVTHKIYTSTIIDSPGKGQVFGVIVFGKK